MEMKSLFGAISPNRDSSEHADEQIREKRERVITPASGNVFARLELLRRLLASVFAIECPTLSL